MSRVDDFILGCPDWATFWQRITDSQIRGIEPGDVFERLTQLYLRTQPEYRAQLKHVWRAPAEVPAKIRARLNLPSTDEGIDILAETRDGAFWAIQCKFRSDTNKRLTYEELSTFVSLSFVTCRDVSLAVVAHTCAKPPLKRKLLGNTTEIGLDRWLSIDADEWKAIQAEIQGRSVAPTPRSPRPHQIAAISAATKHYGVSKAARGRLIMPCGTGKSLTAFWIGQALQAKSIIVAVPSLALIRQGVQDWTREYLAHGEVPSWLVVCSDESTGKIDQDEFVGETYDLGIPATTKPEEIAAFLSRKGGRKIVFTTYQSGERLSKAVRKLGFIFDLAILDEAHKTVGVITKAFANLLSDENISVRRRLFMTATERILHGKNDAVLSMDDEAVYGKRFHQLTFKEAIGQGIISDYKIVTMTVSDAAIRELIEENSLIDLHGDGETTDALSLAAGVALKRAFQRYRVKHAISFHRSIRAASTFADQQTALADVVGIRPKATNLHISSKKSAGERATLLTEFALERRALMTNARCLTEGVDVPAIDCVLFADPKQSVVDIVQAAGRALRPYPGKKFGYILLPLIVPDGMGLSAFAETTEFKQVARTITALSTQDERISEQFRTIDQSGRFSGGVVEISGDVPVGHQLATREFVDQIGTSIWQRVAKTSWRPYGAALDYVRGLRLKSIRDWSSYRISGLKPSDIPSNPNEVYRATGWTTWGNWLGTGTVAPQHRTYRSFEDARELIRSKNFRNQKQWLAFTRSDEFPADIPATPERVYARAGWVGMTDWLGVDRFDRWNNEFRPFQDAREYARSLRLESQKKWYEFVRRNVLPVGFSAYPQNTYAHRGWISRGDWLGTDTIAPGLRVYRDFDDARTFARSLNLRKTREWWDLCAQRNAIPADIPRAPHVQYREQGWHGYGDWLGTGRIGNRKRSYWSFSRARSYVRELGFRSIHEWLQYVRSSQRPLEIPSKPERTYKDLGWSSYGDWLGTGSVAPEHREFKPFQTARTFVHKLRLKSVADWHRYGRSGERPADIPSDPRAVYKDQGWAGFQDWLGFTQNERFRPFKDARLFVRSLRLRSARQWNAYAAGKLAQVGIRPSDIPAAPDKTYAKQGWLNWRDWLGTEEVPPTDSDTVSR